MPGTYGVITSKNVRWRMKALLSCTSIETFKCVPDTAKRFSPRGKKNHAVAAVQLHLVADGFLNGPRILLPTITS